MLFLEYILSYQKNTYFCIDMLKCSLHRCTAVRIADGLHYIMIKHKKNGPKINQFI